MSADTEVKKRLKELTLVFCRRTDQNGTKEILLGMKKRGFGKGKWNGFGGKLEPGETVVDAAKRELLEESHVTAHELSPRGILIFNVPSYPSTMKVFVYEATAYEGEPKESEEMQPKWFQETELPQKVRTHVAPCDTRRPLRTHPTMPEYPANVNRKMVAQRSR